MQYIFLSSAPGLRWNQNKPEALGDALFREPLEAVGTKGNGKLKLGLTFVLSYLDAPPATLEATLRRLLALSVAHDTPVLIALDGQNWWGYRADLWNWFDPTRPGYNPENRVNVEWSGPAPIDAVKIGWRNWGRQIRVLPAPNLAAPRVRDACRPLLARLTHIIKEWADALPKNQRYLFAGVKVGWEASIGINAFYYPNGNQIYDASPASDAQDPRTGLDMKKDFSGGLAPLGYAALHSKGWQHDGPITLADHERIVSDYLAFLAQVARKQGGLKREEIFTHAGGQFAPWEKHYSHRVAVNGDSLPGWSLYGITPDKAGDLDATLAHARRDDWCAAEWLPFSRTPEQWVEAYRKTLSFRKCRFLALYNWEGIRAKPEALAGLRDVLTKGV